MIVAKDDADGGQRFAAFWSVLGVVTGLVVLLTVSDLPWEDILSAIGCSFHRFTCCSKDDDDQTNKNGNDFDISDSTTGVYDTQRGKKLSLPSDMIGSGKANYHVMNTVWDPEYANHQPSNNIQYNGYRSPEQFNSSTNSNIKSYTNVITVQSKEKSKDSIDAMVNWTQQLQEQLKHKTPRETSASSTKQLIHKTTSNDS